MEKLFLLQKVFRLLPHFPYKIVIKNYFLYKNVKVKMWRKRQVFCKISCKKLFYWVKAQIAKRTRRTDLRTDEETYQRPQWTIETFLLFKYILGKQNSVLVGKKSINIRSMKGPKLPFNVTNRMIYKILLLENHSQFLKVFCFSVNP